MIEPRERLGKLAERYRRFAEVEARGVSPTYEKLALAISSSIETDSSRIFFRCHS